MAVRVVQGATSPGTVQVAPIARSVCALLVAIGVPDADLDSVMAILSDDSEFPEDAPPRSFTEIAQQARRAHEIFLRRQLQVAPSIEAAQ